MSEALRLDFVQMARGDEADGHALPLEREHLLPLVLLLESARDLRRKSSPLVAICYKN